MHPDWRLGVCAWSLQPSSVKQLISACERLQLRAVQLPLKVFHRSGLLRRGWGEASTLRALEAAGIDVCSGMFATHGEDYSSLEAIRATGGVRSDAHWKANAALASEDAARAQRLGMRLVTFHAGFLPEGRDDPLRAVMIERLREVIDRFADQGVEVAFETGQETADTLLEVLADIDRTSVGVNFDPANMILYGMGSPDEALTTLLRHVRQLHIKDALPTQTPGTWGTEVVVGEGGVDWEALFAALENSSRVDFMIEREAGDEREADVARAKSRVEPLVFALQNRPHPCGIEPPTPPQAQACPGVGVIGLGFMGATHIAAWARAAADGHPNLLTAVCDRDAARRQGEVGVGPSGAERLGFDPASLSSYAEADELLADPAVEIVSITTPTDSHVPLALAALRMGKHVLLEKPVSLDVGAAEQLDLAAREASVVCMPAQCIRFWPGWDWLIARVDDGSLGKLLRLELRRLASRPDWGSGFYDDSRRSGGVLYDLHVHDADLIRRLVGDPELVRVSGTPEHFSVVYEFSDGPDHVSAEACWDRDPEQPFFMGFEAEFEAGHASWSSARDERLQLQRDGRTEHVPLPDLTGYDGQVRHLLDVVAGRQPEPLVTVGDAVACLRLLGAIGESLESGQPTSL
jgi:predicted dehydrogenase/sugar phosphate isomerase/epimerase